MSLIGRESMAPAKGALMALKTHQEVFVVFFAIFWGLIANVQPRWRAFQWPLMFKLGVVTRRVVLAFFVMDILPVVYFGLTLRIIDGRAPSGWPSLVMQGVLPAFGVFGIYRIWLGVVELRPDWFYYADRSRIPEKYWHVEPTYRQMWNKKTSVPVDKNDEAVKESGMPVVDLADDAGWPTLLAAVFYLGLAHLVPLLFA